MGELYAAHGDRVFNTCRQILGCSAEAEDVTQEVFLKAFAQIRSFRGASRLGSWLLRIAANEAINQTRARARRHLELLEEDADPGDPQQTQPWEQLAAAETRACLDEALQALPVDQRAVLVLREFEQLSYEEIAEALDLPLGTVTSRLVRGRARLAELLGRRLDLPAPTEKPGLSGM